MDADPDARDPADTSDPSEIHGTAEARAAFAIRDGIDQGTIEDMNGANARPADVYDLRGLNCPLPVLKTRRRLSGMPAGSRLWIETTDPLAVIDIPAFCHDDGHRLVTSESVSGGHRFLIERGG